MTNYIVEIQEIDELGWQEGDILNWDLKGEGIVLSKLHDPSGYEVEEE